MKKTRIKISLLVGLSVMATILIVLLIFNIVSKWSIKENSREAIDEIIQLNLDTIYNPDSNSTIQYDDESESTYYAQLIYLIDGLPESEYYAGYRDDRIIKWCFEHPSEELQYAKIGNASYYIRMLYLSDEEGDYTLIAYVNISGEPELINIMTIVLLILAIVIGLIGSIIGYRLGMEIERSQLIQKTFFENTSHELKTPLMTISGYAEGLEKGVVTDYEKTGRIINNQTKRMNSLIEDILYISKLESGVVTLNKEQLEVKSYIQDILMPFEGAILSRNLNLSLELDDGTIYADPNQLEHAISNLITNAIKYAKSSIVITYTNNQLSIWNDGGSISDEELEHIFDRFYTSKNGNTGIGLALVKEIINLHGWKIVAYKTNGGIAFVIREF